MDNLLRKKISFAVIWEILLIVMIVLLLVVIKTLIMTITNKTSNLKRGDITVVSMTTVTRSDKQIVSVAIVKREGYKTYPFAAVWFNGNVSAEFINKFVKDNSSGNKKRNIVFTSEYRAMNKFYAMSQAITHPNIAFKIHPITQ